MTGSRAEYGLMYWLLRELAARDGVELQLVVAAMHLAPEFGRTVDIIRQDGFSVIAEVPCLVSGDDNVALGKSMGLAQLGFVEVFARLAPDILVLVGDRFEVLSAAAAATALRLPIAHLHGGEVSEGSLDETFRHAVTKMSHIHFAAAEPYLRRIIQMGEQPDRVHLVGALGLENILRLSLPDRPQLSADLGLDLSSGYLLLGYHPATLEQAPPTAGLEEILAALDRFASHKVIATKANADPGGQAINERLAAYAAANPTRVRFVDSLGQARYLGAMKGADAVIGNSSSGIIEAPAMDVPTVNVGPRQDGRLQAVSILNCPAERDAVAEAISHALDARFRADLAAILPPYGRPAPIAARVVDILQRVQGSTVSKKSFFDLNMAEGCP